MRDLAAARTFAGPLGHTNVADEPSPTVNWMQVEDGQIRRIRVTFDPRPLVS